MARSPFPLKAYCVFALAFAAALSASAAMAAPAEELGGHAPPLLAAPLTAEAFLRRVRAASVPVAPAYVPKTAHDNSPYRFDMTQNGRRMTAEEFDAWMKSRGIRVATGKPAGAESAAPSPASAAGAAEASTCAPTATTTC